MKLFNKYSGLTRYWFNKAVEYLRKPGTFASLYEVRTIYKDAHEDWAFDCPQRIREHALATACKAVKNAKSKSKKTGVFQHVSFRSKKDTKQRFGFDKVSLKQTSVFGRLFKLNFFTTEEICTELEGTEIVSENGRWFVIVPIEVRIKVPENQRLGVVALDPGVRTFQTYFSDTCFGKIGCSDFTRIFRLCLELDSMQSSRIGLDTKTRKRLKKAMERLRWKIRDSISDIHHKTASFLVKNFDCVLIPFFETSKMVTKLRSKTARAMLTWAHFRFKEFLKFKAKEYSCIVIEVGEEYTSKTCSFCGTIQNIGSKKVMECKNCGVVVDRDFNGARGIFLKNFSRVGGYTRFLNQQETYITNR